MTADKITIVIPTFNRAEYLPLAIESVQAQNGVPTEIIVVDDGSTDRTPELMGGLTGPDLHYIRQENAGVSAARNTGIAAATAPWVAFLDSDDVWLPGKLALQTDELSRHPDAVAHLTNVLIERPIVPRTDLVTLREIGPLFPETGMLYLERPLAFNARHNFGRVQSLLARRSCLTDIGGFNTAYRYFEDTDVMNRLALCGPWVVSNKPLVREIRRESGAEGLGAERLRRSEIGYDNLHEQMTALAAEDLTPEERETVWERRRFYALLSARAWAAKGEVSKARAMLRRGGVPTSVRHLALAVLLLPGAGPLRRRALGG